MSSQMVTVNDRKSFNFYQLQAFFGCEKVFSFASKWFFSEVAIELCFEI